MKKTPFVVLSLLLLGGFFALPAAGKMDFQKELGILSTVFSLIENTYVQPPEPGRLYRGAMNGLLKTLDPYSLYLDKETYAEFKADNEGRFAGTGMEVSVKGGLLHVVAPLDGSGAADAGVKPGDIILKIDGVVTKDMLLADAVRKLRGAPGSKITLTLAREGEKQPVEIQVERRVVNAKGVREVKRLDGGVLYVRIAEFQQHTAEDFKEALAGSERPRGLVLDLRSNPGGLLDAAVSVAENFIPKGELVVETRGRDKSKNRSFLSKEKVPLKAGPIAVLINRGSASGSEIVAGALQDHGLARLFGKKTYGKGCVQSLTPLPDGSAVRITTSHYFTPKGRLIHEIGIAPDEEVEEDAKGRHDRPLEAALKWIKEKSGSSS